MAGHLAAEDRVRLAHRRLMKAWPTRFISGRAAVARDRVAHGVARAQVVDDRRARVLQQERLGEQRGDEVARDELAGAVDEEAAVGVAVPRDPDVGLLATTRSTMCARFSSMSGFAS